MFTVGCTVYNIFFLNCWMDGWIDGSFTRKNKKVGMWTQSMHLLSKDCKYLPSFLLFMIISFFYPLYFLSLSPSVLCWHPNPCAGGTGIFSADSVGLPSIRTERPRKRIASYLKAPEAETDSLPMLVQHSTPIYHTKTCPHMPTPLTGSNVPKRCLGRKVIYYYWCQNVCACLISKEVVRHWAKRVRATGIKAK